MEETWELAALTMWALHTYCLGLSAALILAACQSPDVSVLTFDASSDVKFQQSLAKIETQLNAGEKLALSKAIGRLESYPQDGNCAVTNLLAHAKKAVDPAFRQKLRLTRLHGLTAQQVIDVAEEKHCDAELTRDEYAPPQTRLSKKHEFIYYETDSEALAVKNIKPITLVAAPFAISNSTPTYATMHFSCGLRMREKKISVLLQQGELPSEINANGRLIPPLDKENMLPRNDFWFWQTYSVFFDENRVDFLSYKITETWMNNEFGAEEKRVLAVPILQDKILRNAIFPKMKTSKTMRLENENGAGPTFELSKIKETIERLETQCVTQDSK